MPPNKKLKATLSRWGHGHPRTHARKLTNANLYFSTGHLFWLVTMCNKNWMPIVGTAVGSCKVSSVGAVVVVGSATSRRCKSQYRSGSGAGARVLFSGLSDKEASVEEAAAGGREVSKPQKHDDDRRGGRDQLEDFSYCRPSTNNNDDNEASSAAAAICRLGITAPRQCR
jgi:hypothetical protein